MSVSPNLASLPTHRMPRRLKAKYPERFADATGSNQLHCWSMGEGPFVAGPFVDGLALRPDPDDPDRHGFVEPDKAMKAADYESAITATRELWRLWEE
jgi:hypothetical protein